MIARGADVLRLFSVTLGVSKSQWQEAQLYCDFFGDVGGSKGTLSKNEIYDSGFRR